MTPTHGTGPGPKTRGMATTGKSLRSRPRQWGEREGVKAETPVERAAEALWNQRYDTSDPRERDHIAARAVFASIDVEALAGVLFLADYPGHEDLWDGSDRSPWHHQAEIVLAYLTGADL